MTQENQPSAADVAAAFVAHVQAFHRSLPADEQMLLEQVFALAERAQTGSSDVTGHLAGTGGTFNLSLVTEIGMPALDAASKDAAKLTIKFKP